MPTYLLIKIPTYLSEGRGGIGNAGEREKEECLYGYGEMMVGLWVGLWSSVLFRSQSIRCLPGRETVIQFANGGISPQATNGRQPTKVELPPLSPFLAAPSLSLDRPSPLPLHHQSCLGSDANSLRQMPEKADI